MSEQAFGHKPPEAVTRLDLHVLNGPNCFPHSVWRYLRCYYCASGHQNKQGNLLVIVLSMQRCTDLKMHHHTVASLLSQHTSSLWLTLHLSCHLYFQVFLYVMLYKLTIDPKGFLNYCHSPIVCRVLSSTSYLYTIPRCHLKDALGPRVWNCNSFGQSANTNMKTVLFYLIGFSLH